MYIFESRFQKVHHVSFSSGKNCLRWNCLNYLTFSVLGHSTTDSSDSCKEVGNNLWRTRLRLVQKPGTLNSLQVYNWNPDKSLTMRNTVTTPVNWPSKAKHIHLYLIGLFNYVHDTYSFHFSIMCKSIFTTERITFLNDG